MICFTMLNIFTLSCFLFAHLIFDVFELHKAYLGA